MMHDSFCTRAFRLEEDMSRCAAKPSVHSVVMIYTDRPPSSISLVMSLIAGSALHSRSPLSHPLSAAVLCCAVPSCPVLSVASNPLPRRHHSRVITLTVPVTTPPSWLPFPLPISQRLDSELTTLSLAPNGRHLRLPPTLPPPPPLTVQASGALLPPAAMSGVLVTSAQLQ